MLITSHGETLDRAGEAGDTWELDDTGDLTPQSVARTDGGHWIPLNGTLVIAPSGDGDDYWIYNSEDNEVTPDPEADPSEQDAQYQSQTCGYAVDGWSPILAVITDSERRVLQVVDWTGGGGDKPEVGKYIGEDGFVDTAAEAVNVRGAAGDVSTGGPVDSVNEQTGEVILDADDIDDTSTDHKFVSLAQRDKLDDIEAGARADQTASDIRGLGFFDITNDGPGSGLNADRLDGNHATAFALAAQGALAESAVQPEALGAAATSNDFDDLSNKPTLGTAAALDAGTSAGNVVVLNGSGELPAVSGANLTDLPGGSGAVDSVNEQTGEVILDADDIDDTSTDHKFTTEAGLAAIAANTSHGSDTSNPHEVTKTQVGLSNVDNTSDADKPVSTAAQTALDAKADLVSGKVPTAQIPAIALTEYLGGAADESEMLLLSGQSGDWCIRTDAGMTYVITGSDPTDAEDWTALPHPSAPVTSVNGETGLVILNKSSVGLGSVSNTSDADKPVSDATQAALDLKANEADLGTAAALDAGTVVQSPDGSVLQILAKTQAEYDALDPVSETTIYAIKD